MSSESGVLLLARTQEDAPSAATRELLSLARKLCEHGGGAVTAFLPEDQNDAILNELIRHGADTVIAAEQGSTCDDEVLARCLAVIAEKFRPTAILMAHDSLGADVAPRLAFKLRAGVATDCVAIAPRDGRLIALRPCYGGKLLSEVSTRKPPLVATVRRGSQEIATADATRSGTIGKIAILSADYIARKQIVKNDGGGNEAALESARIVVAGGRGLDGEEGFRMLEELAELLGASVGASRVACDLGWYPHTRQIGLTGRVVSPDLYLAIGISGASQHMVGCAGAKTIVAINNDPEAFIFKAARYGIVGDCKEIIPALIENLKNSGTAK
ncbi:MAG: electron transfer flavoprotein subunit alpha/FixB family protein [Candidatus Binatus sp.]|uniref:electron transfer flavoprotein subunit alpha/FixB family protein n=1 Tax=Candidatus Binatus sp. TaxID=2811406 RepID=UPI00271A0F83|nr:electron transfer flavoprotein subunit alpha/FixB family protein [Candidatus Binatus sp.]MDO8434282.1 electron transfer flavoprotein subunit alpha/FixB family protein [Candidatus Binatus sp.]